VQLANFMAVRRWNLIGSRVSLEAAGWEGNIVTKSILTVMTIISIGAASAAYADQGGIPNGNGHGRDKGGDPISAPEMDPGTGMGALILLSGGLAVVRGRRDKR
jgi:hypothetical protein